MKSSSMADCLNFGAGRKKPMEGDSALQRPASASSREEAQLMQRSARAAHSTSCPIEKLRHLCLSRGVHGIMGFGRIFRRIDGDWSGHLDRGEFARLVQDTCLEVTDEDLYKLFDMFDTDGTGTINVNEFMDKLRPPMADNRRAIVEQAFSKLDKTGDGVLSIADIKKVYSVNSNPRYMSGEDTAEQVMKRFLSNFEDGNSDGTVSRDEFLNYYSGISTTIDNDCFFDLMIRQAYKL